MGCNWWNWWYFAWKVCWGCRSRHHVSQNESGMQYCGGKNSIINVNLKLMWNWVENKLSDSCNINRGMKIIWVSMVYLFPNGCLQTWYPNDWSAFDVCKLKYCLYNLTLYFHCRGDQYLNQHLPCFSKITEIRKYLCYTFSWNYFCHDVCPITKTNTTAEFVANVKMKKEHRPKCVLCRHKHDQFLTSQIISQVSSDIVDG